MSQQDAQHAYLELFGDFIVYLESGDDGKREQFEDRYREIANCTKERAHSWFKQLSLAMRLQQARGAYMSSGFSPLWDSYCRTKGPRQAA